MKERSRNVLRMPEELIIDMNSHLPGDLTIYDIQTLVRGKKFKVLFKCSDALMHTDISEMLDLSVRASNSLKRAGFQTVGDLITKVESFDEIAKIRNCGATSLSEIMGRLFFYQYSLISKDKRSEYMQTILHLNGIASHGQMTF